MLPLTKKLNSITPEATNQYIDVVRDKVLKKIPADFSIFLFGSRANGTNAPYSDVDIGILGKGPIDRLLITDLKEELDETNVPFVCELVDFFNVDPKFSKEALKTVLWWRQ